MKYADGQIRLSFMRQIFAFYLNNNYKLPQYDCGLLQRDILLISSSTKISASLCRTENKDGSRIFLRNAGKHHQTRRRQRQKAISLHTHRGWNKKNSNSWEQGIQLDAVCLLENTLLEGSVLVVACCTA
jgi:hypothetical protein